MNTGKYNTHPDLMTHAAPASPPSAPAVSQILYAAPAETRERSMATMLSPLRDADWSAIAAQLPSDYAALADEHKQLQTQYGNAKITSADWLLRFILLHVGANLPLAQTVSLMEQSGGPRLSAMRLHMKMRRAVPYLQALVERMVPWRAEAKPELWAGYSLALIDATGVVGPGATGSGARLHTKLRAANVAILDVDVTDSRGGETLKRFAFQADELAIADRGYCDAVGIAHVLEQRADVLVRYAATALPAQRRASGEEFDAILGIRGLTDDAVLDLPISFEHDRKRVHGRFIASRLPPAEAEEARRRVRLEHGPRITAEALETAGYLVLFTTVPSERLSASKCLLAFQLRRNIEDRLEQWRSLCGFERLPNYRDDTIVAWIYAKLLLALLLDRMSSRELSPPVQFEPVAPKPRRKRRSKTDLCMGTGEHRIADEEDAPVSAAAS